MKKIFLCIALAVSMLSAPVVWATGPTVTLKLGTLAPRSSSWMAIFARAAAEIKKATGGQVIFKIYPGGRQGDEKVMVAKMRTGQLAGAAVTAVGLGEILPEILVLQTPGLFTSYKELDKARAQLQPEWQQKMSAKGFVLMGWGDVGSVDWHSNRPIATPDALTKASGGQGTPKIWIWNSDPVARATAKALNVTGVPASVPDVLPSLNSGAIDTLFASPLACLQLGWCSTMKSRTTRVWSHGIGAVVLSEKALAKVPEAHRAAVRDTWSKWTGALVRKIRVDNDKARRILAKKGVAPVASSDDAAWMTLARKVQKELVGKIYSQQLLDRVKKLSK